MNRIMVIGCPGAGKSVFSRQLGKITGIEVIHLDNLWWKPDRTTVSREEFDEKLAAVLKQETWIIDGDYRRTMEVRMKACDTVIFLDYPPVICRQGIRERIGEKRDDLPWIEKEENQQLLEAVNNYASIRRPAVRELLEKYRDRQIMIFRSRQQAQKWLDDLEKKGNEHV